MTNKRKKRMQKCENRINECDRTTEIDFSKTINDHMYKWDEIELNMSPSVHSITSAYVIPCWCVYFDGYIAQITAQTMQHNLSKSASKMLQICL